MDRYTRSNAEQAFDRLATALGKDHSPNGGGSWRRVDGQNVAQVGWWELDYNSAYGGFVIHEIGNEAGGVSCPMGHTRHTAREFCSRVSFALDALRVANENAAAR